ncbi:MAG: hypothetical protein K9I68_10655, partial [Bacteroidales bacterium]|nr:hypothetical protein [Bacteroidales bacterium]
NSLKSDILPVLNIGAHAVHIPYHTTWVHEAIDPSATEREIITVKNINEVPGLLNGGRSI